MRNSQLKLAESSGDPEDGAILAGFLHKVRPRLGERIVVNASA